MNTFTLPLFLLSAIFMNVHLSMGVKMAPIIADTYHHQIETLGAADILNLMKILEYDIQNNLPLGSPKSFSNLPTETQDKLSSLALIQYGKMLEVGGAPLIDGVYTFLNDYTKPEGEQIVDQMIQIARAAVKSN